MRTMKSLLMSALVVACGSGEATSGDGSALDAANPCPPPVGTNGAPALSPSASADGGTNGSPVNAATTGNPFAGADMYVNPDYAKEVQSSVDKDPADAALLSKVKTIPTAIWLDKIAVVADVGRHLDSALAQQTASGKPVTTLFVIYDLPNRDCAAKASNGELQVDQGGVDTYKTKYIDAIAAVFKAHPNQRIAAVVEPDSLPNIATNLSVPRCAASEQAYRDSVAYALKTLSAPNVFLYLDAAHAGWLGWTSNTTKMATIFKDVLTAAGGVDKVRGFATNVANYNVLTAGTGGTDIFDYQGNPCHDELTYVTNLGAALDAVGITNHSFLVDTSRDGRAGIRHVWGEWCNNTGAGVGERPRASPGPGLDAYVWVKPPGESDGTSDTTSARFDSFCGMQDAAQPAPEAGQWFHDYFVASVKNANPSL